MKTPRIRLLTNADIEFATAQTAREGWDTTPTTFTICQAHDPAGNFLAEFDNQPAGLITATCFRPAGWIGNLVVHSDYRRRGIGAALMRSALHYLADHDVRSVLLDADDSGVHLYEKLGFVAVGYTPRFRRTPAPPPRALELPPMTPAELSATADLDSAARGYPRPRLLGTLVDHARASFVSRDEGGQITGYALVLPARIGLRFGPCAARDADSAGALLDAALTRFPATPLVAADDGDTPSSQALYETRGFTRQSACLRMVRGPLPTTPRAPTVWALADGALG